MHATILRQLESVGYATNEHRTGGYVELHAVPLPPLPDGEVKVARVHENSDAGAYRAACELARMCGVELRLPCRRNRLG